MSAPEATAPAKFIVLGEHAAVYGQPAIAAPVSSLRAYATVSPNALALRGLHIAADDLNQLLPVQIDSDDVQSSLELVARLILRQLRLPPPDLTIHLHSDIPPASGLGSGAAVATAVARALLAALGAEMPLAVLNEIIFQGEAIYHGTPSGIDNTVIVYEQALYFIKDRPVERLTIGGRLDFMIADTGISASTKIAVGDVRRLVDADPNAVNPVLERIGEIVVRGRDAIERGDRTTLGALMNANQAELQHLTVSSPELDHLIDAALAAGAAGAKLSGGGRGGNMIALVREETAQAVTAALTRAGAVRVFSTSLHPTTIMSVP